LATDDEFRACRRKNYVHSAYVEAAIYVNKSFGSDRAYWMLIRENLGQSVIERVLAVPPGRTRQKQRRHTPVRPRTYGLEYLYLAEDPRVDHLTSQRVGVALVFQAMLGNDAAAEYLRDAGVPIWVIARVLGSTRRRPSAELVEA